MLSRVAPRTSGALRSLVRSASTQSSSVPAPKPLAEATHPSGPSHSTPTTAGQSPNYPKTWSTGQRAREDAYKEARFEQTALAFQPQPLSAMEMIAQEPVRIVHGRKAVCDGGKSLSSENSPPPPLTFHRPSFFLLFFSFSQASKARGCFIFTPRTSFVIGIGPLGHPKVFINLVCCSFSKLSLFMCEQCLIFS